MAVSRNEAERDAHISESVSNLDTVLFSVGADVDQCAVKIFLAELSYSRRKLVHRSRNDVAEVLHHVVDHLGDQKVILDNEHPRHMRWHSGLLICGHSTPAFLLWAGARQRLSVTDAHSQRLGR